MTERKPKKKDSEETKKNKKKDENSTNYTPKKENVKKTNMLIALKASLGIVSTAADKAGISREIHYKWIREDSEYRKAVEDINERALDFAETALFKQMQEGDHTSTIFYLKTKGKKRGYTESQEITIQDNTTNNERIKPVVQSLKKAKEALLDFAIDLKNIELDGDDIEN